MTSILVPTDFSNDALKAVTYAAEVARKAGATIFLLNVIEPSINMVTMQSDSSGEKVRRERSAKMSMSLKSLAKIYPGVEVVPCFMGGAVIPSIIEYAGKENMDLIIMGTKGASGLKKILMGSNTAGTIGRTKIPVLTVPASYEMEQPDAILFATNQFEKDKAVLERLMFVPKLFSAPVHVVVFKDQDGDRNADFIYNEEQLNDYLAFLKEFFPGIVFKGKLLEGSDFERTIDQYVNEHGIDIIAMMTYPKSFFGQLLHKSVTRQMAFHSTIPILAIPAIVEQD